MKQVLFVINTLGCAGARDSNDRDDPEYGPGKI